MAITFANILDMVRANLGDRGSSSTAEITRGVNIAQRKVAGSYRWPSLRARGFANTVAPYTTGTITLTQDDATVTGSLTAFTAAMAGRKLALSFNHPWFEIDSRTSGTELELSEPWPFATVTASAYVIYDDRVDMPTDFDRLHRVWLHDTRRRFELDEYAQDMSLPSSNGRPGKYSMIERKSDGTRRMQLGPCAPDAIYRLELHYQTSPTDGTFAFDDDQAELLVWAALEYLYERDQSGERRERAEARYQRELQNEMARVMEDASDFDLGEMGASPRGSMLAQGNGWDVNL